MSTLVRVDGMTVIQGNRGNKHVGGLKTLTLERRLSRKKITLAYLGVGG